MTDATGTSLTVTGNGTITGTSINLADQATDVLSVSGNANFTGPSGITIASAGTVDFGSLTFNSSNGAVAIFEDNGGSATGMLLTGANTADSLTLTSAGAITDAAATSLIVDVGNADITGVGITLADNAGDALMVSAVGAVADINGGTGSITIGAAGAVNFTALRFNATGAVDITEDSSMLLTSTSTAGGLALTTNVAGGTIAQTVGSSVAATGTTTLTVGAANDITLFNAGNDFDTVGVVSANNVQLRDLDDLNLGAMTVSGNLAVATPAGSITDTGPLLISGQTALSASGDITLDAANDFIGRVTVVTGNNVSLNDINALTLGNAANAGGLKVLGNLALSSNGAISDAPGAVITVVGTTSLSATGNDVALDNLSNNFGGAVSASNVNNLTLQDVSALDLGTVTLSGQLNVNTSSGDVTSSGVVSVGSALNITSAGNITMTSQVLVTGNSIFTANGSAATITLNNAANDFTGTVQFSGITLSDVTVVDNSSLTLSSVVVSNTLSVTAAGITGASPLSVGGITTLTVGAGNNILLSSTSNDFVGEVRIVSANNATLSDTNDILFGTSNVSGALAVTTGNGGAISQAGPLTVGGLTTLTTGTTLPFAGNITLTDTGNDFNTVTIVRGAVVQLTDVDNLDLGATTINGSLTIIASGNVTDSGTLTVGGAPGTTTIDANGFNVLLDTVTNNFAGAVSVVDLDSNSLAASNVTWIDASGAIIGAQDISGNLTVTATAGSISSTAGALGALLVGGNTTLTANDGTVADISVNNAGNNFTGTVTFIGANLRDVSVANLSSLALALPGTGITGNLVATTGGDLTQSGILLVTGATTLNATGNVTLGSANDFDRGGSGDTLAITAGGNVTIVDANAIRLGNITTGGTLDVTVSTGDLLIPLASFLDIGGDLFLTVTTGNLGSSTANNSGALQVVGNSTFTISSLAPTVLFLDNTANDFGGSVSFIANLVDLTLYDNSALVLGASTIQNNLTITAKGISDAAGAISVGGAMTLDALGNDILLTNASNEFNIINVSNAANVTITDATGFTLTIGVITGSLSVDAGDDVFATATGPLKLDVVRMLQTGSDLNLTVGGPLIQTTGLTGGSVVVAGTTTLTMGTADVTLNNGANDFGGLVTINSTTGNITLADSGAGATGLSLTTATSGKIGLTTTGNTTLANPVAGNITLVHTGLGPNGLRLQDLTVLTGGTGTQTVDITAELITIDAKFGVAADDLFLTSHTLIKSPIVSGGSLTANNVHLHADGNGQDVPVMGEPLDPIVLIVNSSANIFATIGPANNGPGFGFGKAENLDTSAFTDVFNRSNQRFILISRFDEIISSVQGSFINAPKFSVDSSQFRTDLNIFGVDGTGVLLPNGQCEDEESPDCAR